MAERIVRTVYSPDRQRRVQIVCRENSGFGFVEERFSDDALEQCWLPTSQRPFSICDSAEVAWREAVGRVPWLEAAASS